MKLLLAAGFWLLVKQSNRLNYSNQTSNQLRVTRNEKPATNLGRTTYICAQKN